MILQNIEDVFQILNSECSRCRNFWGAGHEEYDYVTKEGDRAIFKCVRNDSYEALIAFTTTPQDFKSLEAEIKEIKKDYPWPKRDDTNSIKEEGFKRYKELTSKINTYAKFAPKDLEIKIEEGFCNNCGKDVEITIRKNRIWFGCEDCASLIADCCGP